MGRTNAAERIAKAWQDATGCASPEGAVAKIASLENHLAAQSKLVDAAIDASCRVHGWLAVVAATIGCDADFPSILAAIQAQRQGRDENVRVVDVTA